MVNTSNLVYYVEKVNGTNRYYISIVHTIFEYPVYFGGLGLVTEIFTVNYYWKIAKRSMTDLRLYPTKTFDESVKLAEKIIKQMDEKIYK